MEGGGEGGEGRRGTREGGSRGEEREGEERRGEGRGGEERGKRGRVVQGGKARVCSEGGERTGDIGPGLEPAPVCFVRKHQHIPPLDPDRHHPLVIPPLRQNVHHLLCTKLGLTAADKLDLSVWKANLADRWDSLTEPVKITLIGEREREARGGKGWSRGWGAGGGGGVE